MNLVKCHQRGVFVRQVKCCHVGGVKFSIQPSSQITHLNGLKTMTSKFFFSGRSPLSQSFTKKTLSHNLLSTCEKWNRFCGRYNTPCFLSQKMSLLLLTFFILLSVTWARGHQNIGTYLLILLKLPLLSRPTKNYVHTKSVQMNSKLSYSVRRTLRQSYFHALNKN